MKRERKKERRERQRNRESETETETERERWLNEKPYTENKNLLLRSIKRESECVRERKNNL